MASLPELNILPIARSSAVVLSALLRHAHALQEMKPRGRAAQPGRCRAAPESPTPKSTGKSAKARTAAAMERNRRGARKFRERQSEDRPFVSLLALRPCGVGAIADVSGLHAVMQSATRGYTTFAS